MPTRSTAEQDDRAFLAQRAGVFYPQGHLVMMLDDQNEALVCQQALRLEGISPADVLLVEPPQTRGFLSEIARARDPLPALSTGSPRAMALWLASAIADRLLALAKADMAMIIVRASTPLEQALATRLQHRFRLRFAARYDAPLPSIVVPYVRRTQMTHARAAG